MSSEDETAGARATVEEVTPMEAVRIAAREIDLAGEADSLEHMRMHLETALIWLRDIDPETVREFYRIRHGRPLPAATDQTGGV